MNKYSLFLLFFTSLLTSQAQKKFVFKDRVLVDVYHNNWLHHNPSLKTKWYSRGIAISYNHSFSIVKDKFAFSMGAGVSNHNFYTNSYFSNVVHPDTNITNRSYTKTTAYDESAKPKSNKLAVTYLDIPVELRFFGKKNEKGHQFKFFVGARAGYKYDIHSRMKNSTGKYKDFIYPNAEKWRYGMHFKVGYGRVFMYGFYSLNTVFQENYGESLRPVSLGLSYTFY